MINLSIEQLKLIFESGYYLGQDEGDLEDDLASILASKGWHYDSSSKAAALEEEVGKIHEQLFDLELVYVLSDVLKISKDEAKEMLQTC